MTIHDMLANLEFTEDRESGEGYVVEGLPNVRKLVQEFWNLASNRQKVSVNLLSNDDVSILQVSGRSDVVLRIPRATRWQ